MKSEHYQEMSVFETDKYISDILHEESLFVQEISAKVLKGICNKFIVTKQKLESDLDSLKVSSHKTTTALEHKLQASEETIVMKDESIDSLKSDIAMLKEQLRKEVLAHTHTKEALAACQNELQSTASDLERYFQVSENDRKKVQTAYLEMREKAVEESLKCNKYQSEFSSLKNDKENCEIKLRYNQKELIRLNKQLKKSKSSFEKNLVNKEAQQQQLQYMAHLKSKAIR